MEMNCLQQSQGLQGFLLMSTEIIADTMIDSGVFDMPLLVKPISPSPTHMGTKIRV